MIEKFVQIRLKDDIANDTNKINYSYNSITLGYPCINSQKCTPYIVEVQQGYYLFECWGSVAGTWRSEDGASRSTPGYGGYTSGRLYIKQNMTFYVYIGNTGYFNAIKELTETKDIALPGGATDVRLNSSENWWDNSSLISRIMVAGGGGSSEWPLSIGGNGGGIIGGESTSGKDHKGNNGTFPATCPGANQTSGSICPEYNHTSHDGIPASGTFGSAGIPQPINKSNPPSLDYGGLGGGGYYGGTSYVYAFAGSGGSSYVSGHKECNSVTNNSTEIIHSGSPNHYSDIIFENPKIITGGETMPLPYHPQQGNHTGEGAFRITLLLTGPTDFIIKPQQINILFFSISLILTCKV